MNKQTNSLPDRALDAARGLDLYQFACEQLARVGAAWRLLPGERYARHALCPCASGYRAALGGLSEIDQTPRLAALALLRRIASYLSISSFLGGTEHPIPHALLDAIGEAFEVLGGDWRAALWPGSPSASAASCTPRRQRRRRVYGAS